MAFMGKSVGMLFPMLSVKFNNIHCAGLRIETAYIYIHSVWVGARNVKRFYSASGAEVMLGYSGVECVGCEIVFS